MRTCSNVVALIFTTLTFASVSVAQKPEPATVMSRDGATKLELINHQIIFQFTDKGAREASRGVAPKPGKKNWNWMDDALQGASAGAADMRIVFPIEDVRDARYDHGTLTLYMTSRALDAPASDRRGLFKYEDVPEDQAQSFVREFRRLKASS